MAGVCVHPAGTRLSRRPPMRVIAAGALALAFTTYAALDAGPHALPIVLGYATEDQRLINSFWRERRHEPADLRRTRVQDWVESHTRTFGMAAARPNGLRALDPHVTIISLNCTQAKRCMDLQRSKSLDSMRWT